MTILTIDNYTDGACYSCNKCTDPEDPYCNKWECEKGSGVCYLYAGYTEAKTYHTACWKFPLTDLPSNANVTKVRLRYTIVPPGGGAAGLWNFVPYCGVGQADPGPADCESFYNCCFGVAYVSSTNPRNPGTYWETLGDGENAQACIDVENAKSAVNRFSVGCSEQNQDDPHCQFYGRPVNQSAVLEITYELPPAVGYSYSDGLVSVSVLAIMRKAILAVCRRVAG